MMILIFVTKLRDYSPQAAMEHNDRTDVTPNQYNRPTATRGSLNQMNGFMKNIIHLCLNTPEADLSK